MHYADYLVANYWAEHSQSALYRAGLSRYGVIIECQVNIAQPDNPRPLSHNKEYTEGPFPPSLKFIPKLARLTRVGSVLILNIKNE